MQDIHYREQGTGPVLVLIHGFCETSEIWSNFANSLSASFRVILPDLPGFGKSSLPKEPFSIDDIGLLMLHWLEQLKEECPIVIGHSLGGYVTLAMAHVKPSFFGGIGLFHSTADADSDEKKENRNKVIDFVGRHGVPLYADSFVPGLFCRKDASSIPEVLRIASQTTPDSLMAYAAAMRDRPARHDVISGFPKRILFIAGDADTVVPAERLEAQSQAARFPVFYSLPSTGHMGMLESEPKALKIVSDFVRLCLKNKPGGR